MGYYETEYDEDGNSEGVSWVKEEPDCYLCSDGHSVPGGKVNRLLGRRWVSCPSCNPTRLTVLYQRSRLWMVRGWIWRLRRPAEVSDEAPF